MRSGQYWCRQAISAGGNHAGTWNASCGVYKTGESLPMGGERDAMTGPLFYDKHLISDKSR